MKKFYISTPLYYVNAPPHIGHAYTTIAADILARYKRMRGSPTHLLTGTDEHGSKIEAVSKEAGQDPRAYADSVAVKFKELWKHLDIQYDDFIRTTEERHTSRVQAVFAYLMQKGDIYKGLYTGFYCVWDETYWTESEAPEESGKRLCPNPDCRRPLTLAKEESYFFRLSDYQQRLLKHYQTHSNFLRPSHRANEILRFVESGLRDLAVSRSKVSWGIPVPGDPKHVVYVWFDALLNYVTAAGYQAPGAQQLHPEDSAALYPGPKSEELWPADVHLVGKEIYRFHTVIWPAMLMALNLPLPHSVFAHGWWTVEGEKMSKSKGNFINPVDITRDFGVDALRYFLFREMPFGNDGDFSRQALLKRYNAELANDLGNLLSRVVNMVDKYLVGELPGKPALERSSLTKEILGLAPAIDKAMEELAFQEALNLIWSIINRLNQEVDKQAPWTKAKTDPQGLKLLLFDLVSSIRIVGGCLTPFMPQTAAKIQSQLGVRQDGSGAKITKGPALFPRK